MDDTFDEDLLAEAAGFPRLDPQQALEELLRRQQRQQGQLGEQMQRQQGQASNMRSLSLLTSFGANPLLQGVNRTAGQQADSLDSRGARTEQRMSQGGVNPLRALALRQAAEREKRLAGNADALNAHREKTLTAQQEKARAAAAAAATKAGKKDTDDAFKNADALRKELNALPEVKDFPSVDAAYAALKATSKDQSGPAGIATIFNFMKILDPGVAVMEGDVNLIRSSGGPAAKYANLYDYALTGNPLPGDVRADILRQADTIYAQRKGAYDKRRSYYGKLAKERGLDPSRIFDGYTEAPIAAMPPDLDLDAPPPSKPQPAKPSPTQKIRDAVKPKGAASNAPPPPSPSGRQPVKRTPSKDRKWLRIDYSDGTSETVSNG